MTTKTDIISVHGGYYMLGGARGVPTLDGAHMMFEQNLAPSCSNLRFLGVNVLR